MENEIRNMVCVVCPVGCQLNVTLQDGQVTEVKGNNCKRGIAYAKTECVNPVRTLTTIMKVVGGRYPTVSVKTDKPIPKNTIFECMKEINKVELNAPINIGNILIKNICNTGSNVIATSNNIIRQRGE